MRGTGSNDVTIDERLRPRRAGARRSPVRRARPAAAGDRQHRVLDHRRRLPRRRRSGPASTRSPRPASKCDDPSVQRQIGLMSTTGLQIAAWALDGALAVVGDDPLRRMDDGGRGDGGQARDRHRRHRDLRHGDGRRRRCRRSSRAHRSSGPTATSAALKFHPLTPEATLLPRRPAGARRALRRGVATGAVDGCEGPEGTGWTVRTTGALRLRSHRRA